MSENLTRPDRLQIMLDAQELAALDDFRFSRRMPSRAAAVRELLRRGLAAEGYGSAPTGALSQSFGVIETPGRDAQARSPEPRGG